MANKTLSLEDTFKQLEDIISRLDNQEITLEESFDLYTEGMKMIKSCNSKIDKVEKKLRVIGEEEEI